MSLQLALAQIQRPSWWFSRNEPWAEPDSNKARANETAQLRAQFFKSFDNRNNPATMEQLSKEFDCTTAKIRSIADPFIKSGNLIRGINSDNKVTLEKRK